VALPGLELCSISPPSFRIAATSSAQKNELVSVLLGHSKDLAIPMFENGFPTHFVFAKCSIFLHACFEQPSCKYV
tara:strand:- start:140 stop:364 length:225 start_codon:yes stop_codon:yes gene_type:complete